MATRAAGIVGRTYLERGRPVVVLAQWVTGSGLRLAEVPGLAGLPGGTAPRNVLIRREDGTLVVRPFRGLRRST